MLGCASGHGRDDVPWNVPIGEEQDSGDVDVDPHGTSTSSEVQTDSGMMPPPPDDDSTSESSSGIESTSSSTSSSSESTAATEVGDPIWTLCDDDDDCESAICFFAIHPDTGDPLSAYCTNTCEDAGSDCPTPETGDAAPACLSSTQGDSLCALDCSGGETCPFGMECMLIGEAAYCF